MTKAEEIQDKTDKIKYYVGIQGHGNRRIMKLIRRKHKTKLKNLGPYKYVKGHNTTAIWQTWVDVWVNADSYEDWITAGGEVE